MKTVLCFGDSNTHGTLPMSHPEDRRRLGPSDRWPGVLSDELGADFRIVEEGLPGRTTLHDDPIEGDHMNGRLGLAIALATHRPIDLVVLMLGTNDLKTRFSVTSLDIATSIERLASLVRASDCGPGLSAPEILIVSPPKILEVDFLGDKFMGGAAKSEALGAHCRTMADRLSFRCLDAANLVQSSPIDGIHFQGAEHKALGQAIAQAVNAWANEV